MFNIPRIQRAVTLVPQLVFCPPCTLVPYGVGTGTVPGTGAATLPGAKPLKPPGTSLCLNKPLHPNIFMFLHVCTHSCFVCSCRWSRRRWSWNPTDSRRLSRSEKKFEDTFDSWMNQSRTQTVENELTYQEIMLLLCHPDSVIIVISRV